MAFFNPNPILPDVPLTQDLTEALSFGTNQPIVLLPVRLETRFFAQTDGVELRVRIYPDKVQIDAHEPELTSGEITWGKAYWEQTWRAANDENAKKAAFRVLAKRFGGTRAAWIARALTPTNPADRPTQTLALDAALPKPPKFPAPTKKAAAWSKAPVTRVLPKRWHVLGYSGNTLVAHAAGNPVPDQLAVGPDPAATAFGDPDLPIDPGMKWMIDFDEAERVGMGVRIKLTTDQAARGFDILLALGTRAATNAPDQTKDLAALLDAHHYTDGLGFVLQGTPSNNTPDAPSGFSSSDPAEERAYAAEFGQAAIRAGDGSNADTMQSALGLAKDFPATLSHVANAAIKESSDALHMNRALWPATLGYFLDQQMGNTPLTRDDRTWARQFFVQHVRAAGPLPTLRVGKQPYGVLPVTSLNHWKPKTGEEAAAARDTQLRMFLLRLRNQWRNNLLQVPRVGRSDDPDKDFTDILSMDGVSSGYAIRHLMGEATLSNVLSQLVHVDQSLWWTKQRELTKASLSAVGLDWDPRLAHATYTGWFAQLKGPAVQEQVQTESSPLTPNYIELLLNTTDPQILRNETFSGGKPRGLLYSILRVSLLLEYWNAAANLYALDPSATVPREMLGLDADLALPGTIPTVWELLARPLTAQGGDTCGHFLATLKTAPSDAATQTAVARLLELRESLTYLQTTKAAKLQRSMAGTLDLCSHRLDAWITAFASKRLAEMRKAAPSGVLLGGYGWVMNLKPAPSAAKIRLAPNDPELLLPANNPGYTHTPSLAQAATVAVLRNGHLTHSDDGKADLLALDLSSERVRLAEWLLDGVRAGQPLGALFGYRFERRLQDAGLQDFIASFRDVAPLVAKKLSATLDKNVDQATESVAANNVVDGLVLHGKWRAIDRSLPALNQVGSLLTGCKKPPNPNRLQQQASNLVLALNQLDDAVDAVSDALLAEGVHQAIQGNPLRAGSTLDAVASGEAPPPELHVVQTPRTGAALTERMVVLFGGAATVAAEWGTPSVSHRADAEPQLNAWVSRLLGNPTKVRCVIEQLDAKGAVAATKELKLSELKLAPLDLIYAAEGGRDGLPSELEHRLLYTIARKTGGLDPNATLRVNPHRGSNWAVNDVSYAEFLELLRCARKLVTAARAIDGSDLAPPEQNQVPAVNLTELQARADAAEKALLLAQADLQKRLQDGATTTELLREVILRSSTFGIAGTIPLSRTGDASSARDTLVVQAQSVLREVTTRVDRLNALKAAFKPDTATDDQKRSQHLERLSVVFGKAFVVLPTFTAANAAELNKALADSRKVQDGDSLNVVTWLTRFSRVREGLARLSATLNYAEALETGEKMRLRVAQLPYRDADRWVGLPLAKGQALSPSRFSLVVQSGSVDVAQPMAGVLIDEWVTVVPNATETTGVVFQYDQPDATPPQCILLAIPPDPDQSWTVHSLQQVVVEALDLARLRAVDPEALDEVGHYLPGAYFAFNPTGDTISTDFSSLK
ncbi:MAG TPA: hypothetical protein VHM70_11255 [Polyangiaceae bacterium]|nr:hypothetical protein [Polyangiaceae bacterium]